VALELLYHLLQAYEFFFRYFSSTFSRQREYNADALASRCFGGNVLPPASCGTRALPSSSRAGVRRHVPAAARGRIMRNMYRAFRAFSRTLGEDELECVRRRSWATGRVCSTTTLPPAQDSQDQDSEPRGEDCADDARTIFENPTRSRKNSRPSSPRAWQRTWPARGPEAPLRHERKELKKKAAGHSSPPPQAYSLPRRRLRGAFFYIGKPSHRRSAVAISASPGCIRRYFL